MANIQNMEKCSICLENANPEDPTMLTILLQGCGHAQHYNCISRWARESNKCPVCREMISPEDRDLLGVEPELEVIPEEQFVGFEGGIYEPAIIRRRPPPPPPRREVVQIHIPEEVLMQMPSLDVDGTEWVENLTSLLEQFGHILPSQVQERPQQVQERPRSYHRPRSYRRRGPNDIARCHFHWNLDGTVRGQCRHGFTGRGCLYRH